jgi:hypothetical protein
MPVYKPRLTRKEQARYRAVAQKLVAAGVNITMPAEEELLGITIGGPPASYIHQVGNAFVVYAVWVSMTAKKSGIILLDFRIAASWDSEIGPACSEVTIRRERKTESRYVCPDGRDYLEDDVLNDVIDEGLHLSRPGDTREGWLLAMGQVPVPERYGARRPAPVEVTLSDQFGQAHTAVAELLVERSARATRSSVQPSSGLYQPADTPVPLPSSTELKAPRKLRVDVGGPGSV